MDVGFHQSFEFPGTARHYRHVSEKRKPNTRRDTLRRRREARKETQSYQHGDSLDLGTIHSVSKS